jgi:hypothetical protein
MRLLEKWHRPGAQGWTITEAQAEWMKEGSQNGIWLFARRWLVKIKPKYGHFAG